MQLIDLLNIDFIGEYSNPFLGVQQKLLAYKKHGGQIMDSDVDSVKKVVSWLLSKRYSMSDVNSGLLSHVTDLVLHNTTTAESTQAVPKAEALDELYSLWSKLISAARIESKFEKSAHTAFAANVLKDIFAMDFVCSNFIAAHLVAHAKNLQSTSTERISADTEAVQIEWISNGILVRGKGADGAFCNYYRDTSQFISQSVGSRAIQFVKDKEPKVGDTCILYFGMSDEASE